MAEAMTKEDKVVKHLSRPSLEVLVRKRFAEVAMKLAWIGKSSRKTVIR